VDRSRIDFINQLHTILLHRIVPVKIRLGDRAFLTTEMDTQPRKPTRCSVLVVGIAKDLLMRFD